MSTYDMIIRNGNVYGGGLTCLKGMDVAVKDGKIVTVCSKIDEKAPVEIDASDKLISPGFIESHIHLDMADYTDKQTFMKGASSLIDKYIVHGTTAIKAVILQGKSNITCVAAAEYISGLAELREIYKGRIDIYSVVPFAEEYKEQWVQAVKAGEIDYIGGVVNSDNYVQEVDKIFAQAVKYCLPIDIDCDDTDVPDINAFLYIIRKTMEYKFQRMVTCNHVTALDAAGLDEAAIVDAITRCARAIVYVTTETSSDMYRRSWKRRGPTRVRELIDSGVGISIASDGCQDSLRPFGNCNLLEEALLTANIHKFATHAELTRVFEMITIQPALNLGLEGYGILPGSNADIVILDAPDTTEAILSKSSALYVIKQGNIVAEVGRESGHEV